MRDIELVSKNVNHETQVAAIFKRANRSLTLKFEDVIYKVKQKAANTSGEKGVEPPEKVILKGLTGKVVPGEMLAVLGPSGSGKTTLLTALGGKQLDGTVEGNITYNNKPFSNSLKRNMGFVAQDDVLFANLTVLETLVFTAFLRLPNSLTKQEKIMHAEAVISELGLDACKNTAIGGGFVRGVSGGERKRVSIGQEILINPSLLLLDEPTSGLDSTTAQRIVDCLWELGKGGRTIVITIHQPSSRLFYMFDKILLLSEGHPLYFGLGSEVMDYFAAVGFAPSVAMNPADFLLDLVNGISPNDKSRKNGTMVKQNLIDAYRTNLDKKVKAEVQAVDDDHVQVGNNDKQYPEERWATTWWEQFTVLLRRGVKERKHQTFTYVTVPQIFAVSILCGLIWWQSDISHLQDQIGLLFFTNGFWNFYPLYQAIFTILEERRMLAKERSSGMYRLSSYFMSRLISDLPMDLALPTMFMTITYWMSGLKRTAADFLLTLFAQLLNVVVSSGLGLALGALVVNPKVATTLGSVITLSFQLASGYYTQHVPSFIAWVKYLSIAQNTYKLLLGSQFKADETYPCGDHGDQICLVRDFPGIKVVGLDGQMYAVLALVIMFVGCRLIAYCALMSVGATKN